MMNVRHKYVHVEIGQTSGFPGQGSQQRPVRAMQHLRSQDEEAGMAADGTEFLTATNMVGNAPTDYA